MLLPEVLFNKEAIKYKLNRKSDLIKKTYNERTEKRVFVPERCWLQVCKKENILKEKDLSKRMRKITKFSEEACILTWGYTKKIYNISEDIFNRIVSNYDNLTKMLDETPSESLKYFPDYCAWFQFFKNESFKFEGFYVRPTLTPKMFGFTISFYFKNHKEPDTVFLEVRPDLTVVKMIEQELNSIEDEVKEMSKNLLSIFLIIVLLVCKDPKDLDTHIKSNSDSDNYNIKGDNIPFISKHVTVREIDIEDITHPIVSKMNNVGSKKRPHIRSGFERVYWTGPGRTIPKIKWVNSVFVNSDKVSNNEVINER